MGMTSYPKMYRSGSKSNEGTTKYFHLDKETQERNKTKQIILAVLPQLDKPKVYAK